MGPLNVRDALDRMKDAIDLVRRATGPEERWKAEVTVCRCSSAVLDAVSEARGNHRICEVGDRITTVFREAEGVLGKEAPSGKEPTPRVNVLTRWAYIERLLYASSTVGASEDASLTGSGKASS
jgi:hypothetical protein